MWNDGGVCQKEIVMNLTLHAEQYDLTLKVVCGLRIQLFYLIIYDFITK